MNKALELKKAVEELNDRQLKKAVEELNDWLFKTGVLIDGIVRDLSKTLKKEYTIDSVNAIAITEKMIYRVAANKFCKMVKD